MKPRRKIFWFNWGLTILSASAIGVFTYFLVQENRVIATKKEIPVIGVQPIPNDGSNEVNIV